MSGGLLGWGSPLLLVLTVAACGGDAEPPERGGEADAPADPTGAAGIPAVGEGADTTVGHPGEGLPVSALDVVREASRVWVGPLRIVSVDEAEAETFASEDRVAGYPVDGTLRALSPAESSELRARLLDPGGYARPPGERCRNSSMVGARFTRGEGTVELALGVECRQAIWAFPRPGEPGRWGATLGQETTARVLPLFSPEADP